jgi:hypothetical protein
MQREGGYGEEPFIAIPPGIDDRQNRIPQKLSKGDVLLQIAFRYLIAS